MRMASGLLSLWLVAACSPSEQPPPVSPPTASATAPAPTASAPPPVETAPPVASVAPTPPASASAPPPAVATYPTPSFPKKPKTFLPKHGQEAWAVYLAAFEKIGPEFNAATSAWIKTDLAVASGDVECDDGAKGKVKGAFVVRTYLRTEAEAKAFAKETKPEPAGVFKVKVMCAD